MPPWQSTTLNDPKLRDKLEYCMENGKSLVIVQVRRPRGHTHGCAGTEWWRKGSDWGAEGPMGVKAARGHPPTD